MSKKDQLENTELTFEDKVLMQLQMQNDKLYTIKSVAVFFLICSFLSIVYWLFTYLTS